MSRRRPVQRVAVLGWGAIGRRVHAALRERLLPDALVAAYLRPNSAATTETAGLVRCTDTGSLLAWQPDLAVECAGHAVVADVVPALLRSGVDVLIASAGALGDAALRAELEAAAREGGAEPIVVSGGIGALDALRAARTAGLAEVRYTGRKPPQAWAGTPAAERFDLDAITVPTVIFEGFAATAARVYPKNANVTAAVALAGVGFERTSVTLVADPTVTVNVHELDALGAFGRLSLRLENEALPDNPKTSWLAVLSIEAALAHYLNPQSLS